MKRHCAIAVVVFSNGGDGLQCSVVWGDSIADFDSSRICRNHSICWDDKNI